MDQVFIIAEAGVNHNGCLATAKQLVDAAIESGADAVKFQAFKAEELACQDAPKAAYQERTTPRDDSQFAMLKRLELDEGSHRHLLAYCRSKAVEFMTSPFGMGGAALMKALNLSTIKIPSGEITNLPLLETLGRTRKKIILSTGMATLEEIRFAVNTLIGEGAQFRDLSLLHCCTQYPTPFRDANLLAIQTLADAFPDIRIGYSDHTLGIEAPIAAVALGARVIEKHFTLDASQAGPDHAVSLEPDALKRMVSAIRNIELGLGNGKKEARPAEVENITIVRKSIVAAVPICKGDTFTRDNLTVKRPGTGVSPVHWYKVIGRKAKENFKKDQQIRI